MFFYGYSLWLKLDRKRHFSLYLFIRHCLSEFSCRHSQFRIPDSGFRIPGSGFRVPGSGFRVPSSGFQFSDFRFARARE